jgi:hypothetical protein
MERSFSMTRQLSVTALGRSWESGSFQDKMSYRVAASEGKNRVVFEARIALGILETLDNPEETIKEHYSKAPLPEDGKAVDLNL